MEENKTKSSFLRRFWWIFLLILIGIAAVAFLVRKQDNFPTTNNLNLGNQTKSNDVPTIKNISVKMAPYNESTNFAGDFKFTKGKLYNNKVFHEFGEFLANTPDGKGKLNPQVSFALPVGTKVRALADGEVFQITKLYSNDYAVQLSVGKDKNWVIGNEHVVNPVVKVGDKVKAGDMVAEVGEHGTEMNSGELGVVEIDIFKASGTAGDITHYCPFLHLDPSVKDTVIGNITKLMSDWENYKGDSSIYDESKQIVPGCLKEKLTENEAMNPQ